MRKKVDDRIRTLIENGVKLRHRSMFLIVGDKSRDQVTSLFLNFAPGDFEALTPNLLARTIETVEGGGLIILLLRSLSSLTSLYTMVMVIFRATITFVHESVTIQGKAVITFLDAILDKTLRSTVALIAARGRGKSAALGLAVAGAVAAGYSNIFVTAPSPENLKTLFEFVCRGINALEYKEHLHYDLVKSADPELKKATIQINIYKQHRQTIQVI
ncbi:hypothetical protein GW17_00018886 [Ensete ventricosum]|nr:hypothetical protein GW17_00018886 [Ensete ventricosum]